MWRAMRQLRTFDNRQIALCTEGSREAVRRFMALLRRAGFITPAADRQYRLVRDTGPKAPVLLHRDRVPHGLLDCNTGHAHGLDGAPPPPVPAGATVYAGLTKRRLRPRRRRGGRA
jgi:hypothetical protein